MHVIAPHGATHVVGTAAHAPIFSSAVIQVGCPVQIGSDTYLIVNANKVTLFQIK